MSIIELAGAFSDEEHGELGPVSGEYFDVHRSMR
jgi:hypothetical protein